MIRTPSQPWGPQQGETQRSLSQVHSSIHCSCRRCAANSERGSYLWFLQLYCPTGTFPLENSGCFLLGKPAATVALPILRCMLGVDVLLWNPPNSDTDRRIFNNRTCVNACDRTRGCTGIVRESALKVDSRRKIPCHTEKSNLPQRRAGPMLYQLSYIPADDFCFALTWPSR